MYNIRNRVQLIGRLGNDPEVKSFDNNRKMARLSIATSESYKNGKGEKVTETHWHTIVVWGKLADKVESTLQKGEEVMVEGKLQHRQYTDKDGVKRSIFEVEAHDILLMGARKTAAAEL